MFRSVYVHVLQLMHRNNFINKQKIILRYQLNEPSLLICRIIWEFFSRDEMLTRFMSRERQWCNARYQFTFKIFRCYLLHKSIRSYQCASLFLLLNFFFFSLCDRFGFGFHRQQNWVINIVYNIVHLTFLSLPGSMSWDDIFWWLYALDRNAGRKRKPKTKLNMIIWKSNEF